MLPYPAVEFCGNKRKMAGQRLGCGGDYEWRRIYMKSHGIRQWNREKRGLNNGLLFSNNGNFKNRSDQFSSRSDEFLRYSNLKDRAIWLAESFYMNNSRTRFFPDMRFSQNHRQRNREKWFKNPILGSFLSQIPKFGPNGFCTFIDP